MKKSHTPATALPHSPLLAAAMLAVATSCASATVYYWDSNGTTAGGPSNRTYPQLVSFNYKHKEFSLREKHGKIPIDLMA